MYSDSDSSFESDQNSDLQSQASTQLSNSSDSLYRRMSDLSDQEDSDSDEEMNGSQNSNNTDITEPYEIDENQLEQIYAQPVQENIVDDSVILINDTQQDILQNDAENEDDDVIIIPQNIETIDLCTQPINAFNTPIILQNEVIEIDDSPSRRNIALSQNNSRHPPVRISPYQRNNRNRSTTPQVPTSSNSNALSDLNESQDLSQTKRIKINCPICLESVIDRNPQSTSCGHIFCKVCLISALQNAKKCPMCRKGIGKNGFHNIHLS